MSKAPVSGWGPLSVNEHRHLRYDVTALDLVNPEFSIG